MPTKDANGVDTYNNSNYNAPVQAVIGMAGFALDNFTTDVSCSLSCINSVYRTFNVDIHLQIVDIHVHRCLQFMYIYPYFRWCVETICIGSVHVSLFVNIFVWLINELAKYFVHAQSNSWSLKRIAEFGYVRGNATKQELYFEVIKLNFTLWLQNLITDTHCLLVLYV